MEKFNRLVSKLNRVYLKIKLELNKEQTLSKRLYIVPNEAEIKIEAVENIV
ncbi:hypothetical protein LEP1GSC062_2430 [Leptospira alexanderi serovar Manhao 3 str. L 60]|uniref:Uncharacterized protein n=1 Tax=Leptospira alexanderi serovar Manhao 3 str. L 60 TaxID=1049759 RepID=V6IFN8_9LEPT|nr:hypothetical protein LEP1GSC062_2430 [Leptospira alexanderi serovar Manhao 3 str. L 60]